MKKRTSSRSTLLLMEMIIAILFFSVVSAVCLQLFVKAHNLGKDTEELDMAVRQASSVAEVISKSARPMDALQKIYTDSDIREGEGFLYFDKNYQACPQEDALYYLDISSTLSERMDSYNIAVYRNGRKSPIYSLKVASYRQYVP